MMPVDRRCRIIAVFKHMLDLADINAVGQPLQRFTQALGYCWTCARR
jgi:hypothetical protein